MTATSTLRSNTTREYRRLSQAVRQECGQSGTPYAIETVDGFAAPAVVGRSYYWTTPSGKTEVRYPSAYKWPTWYHASTRRIQVGRGWLIANGLV